MNKAVMVNSDRAFAFSNLNEPSRMSDSVIG
jgi:hypothetical protein